MSGQPAGSMTYPPYIEDFHKQLLTDGPVNISDAIENAVSPYASAYSYDPETDLAVIDAQFDALSTEADGAITALDFDDIIAQVSAVADDIMMSAADIDAAEAAFKTKHLNNLTASQSRLAGSLSDFNSANSSAFFIGMALIEEGFNTDVAEFRSKVLRETNAQRAQLIINGASAITKIIASKVDIQKLVLDAQSNVSRGRIVASKEYLNEEIQIAERDANWEIDLLKEGGDLLGAVGRVGMTKVPLPKWASGLSGFMGGAASAAPLFALGPEVGVIGMLAMGILSGAVGLTQGA